MSDKCPRCGSAATKEGSNEYECGTRPSHFDGVPVIAHTCTTASIIAQLATVTAERDAANKMYDAVVKDYRKIVWQLPYGTAIYEDKYLTTDEANQLEAMHAKKKAKEPKA